MPLIKYNEGLLRVGNSLANNLDCCCGGTPCECQSGSECVPEGQTNHRDPILVISNVPDEVIRISTSYLYPCTSRVCSPASTLTSVTTHKITGMSQLNGSYPILYLRYDPIDGWVDAEYGTGCNYWAWPEIEFELEWETTTANDHTPFSQNTSPCNPTSSSSGGAFTSKFSTYTATLDSPAAMLNYPPGALTLPNGLPGVPSSWRDEWWPCTLQPPHSSDGTRYTNSPFSTGNPFSPQTYGSGIANSVLGVGGHVGPAGRPINLPAPLPGYQVRYEEWCQLGFKKSDRWTEEVTLLTSSVGGTGNCAQRTEVYYSPFRMTREVFINP